ncbi:MAG: hypothetical protein GY861_27465 [bacterium]|nr:hypothetical protein [bacterium]
MIDDGGMDYRKDLTEYGSVVFDKGSLNCSMRSSVKHLTDDSVDKLVEVYIASARDEPLLSKGRLSKVGQGGIVLTTPPRFGSEDEQSHAYLFHSPDWAVMQIIEQGTGELLYHNPNIHTPYVEPVIPEVILLEVLLTTPKTLLDYTETPDIFNS